jgi:N-acetylglucosaminyldiphosphoundecaprenol N-acetyl-beta-D-mannosaminyltransferase
VKILQDKVTILGVTIDNITEEEAAQKTKKLIEESNKSCKIIVAPNVEFIMQAQKDKEFYDILKEAELATPDSIGVMIAGKLQKKPFKQRIPGQAYFRKILETAEKEGWTVYLLGGKDDIPLKTKENVERIYPNLKIVGYHEGFFEKDSEEEVINQINELKPNILFVAMGAPRQEKWIAKHKNELKVDVAAGQGGTFDYEAGNIKRAPKWIQKIGMEWFWRLILQPSRIKRMYVLPIYLLKIVFTKDITKGKWND